jgi:hypothetical protein
MSAFGEFSVSCGYADGETPIPVTVLHGPRCLPRLVCLGNIADAEPGSVVKLYWDRFRFMASTGDFKSTIEAIYKAGLQDGREHTQSDIRKCLGLED